MDFINKTTSKSTEQHHEHPTPIHPRLHPHRGRTFAGCRIRHAGDKPAETAPEIDIEARRQSIVNLEQHIVEREARLAEISEDIIRLDNRIEERVGKIVDKLKTLKDSKDSKLRVAQTKEQVIAGLREAIQAYDITRRRLKEELAKANPAVPKDTLTSDVKVFDEKIEKRVDQIMAITNSLATHKDYAKYIRTRRSGRWGGTSTRKNPDYYHNRKQTTRSNQDRKAIGDAIMDSIEDLQRKNRDLETKLKTGNLPEVQRSLLREERDTNDELIARRES